MADNPSAKRRWFLLALLFLVLVALGGGAWYVVRRGTYKEGLYEKALRALEEGRREDCEQQLRYIVESNPGHAAAKAKLTLLLTEDRKFDEIEELARSWVDSDQNADLAWKIRIENALRRLRFDEAVQFSRMIADRDPEYAQWAMVRARDGRGSFWDRLEAQRMAVSLATSSDSDATKARMLLFAAETLLDIRHMAPEVGRDTLLRQAHAYLEEGRAALRRARQTAQVPMADILRARMQIHSEMERERAVGLKTLQLTLKNNPADHGTRAALAAYATQTGNWEEAERLIGELRGEAFLLWLRAVRSLASVGRKDEVMRLLEDAPFPDAPAVTLLRAQVLLAGDETDKAEAASVLGELLQQSEIDPASAVQAFRLLSAGGQREAGLEMLETINEATPDTRIEALLAGALPATGVERERALERIERIAARVEDMPQSVQVMRMLRQGDEAALLAYLGAQIELGGQKGRLHRLLRALAYATLASREKDKTKAAAHKESSTADLEALLADEECGKSLLASSWRVALLARDLPLAGRLCAKAIGMDGAPYNLALSCVLLGRALREADMRSSLAAGLREGAAEGTAGALIGVVADSVEKGAEGEAALRPAVEGIRSDPGSTTPALFLLVQLAHMAKDFEPAEAYARELSQRLPDSPITAAMLGEYLLRRRQFDEVLEVTEPHADASVQIGWLRVSSLQELERKEEALALAREVVERFPSSAAAHVILAGIHLVENRESEALAVLGMAPQSRDVLALRARLLEQRDEGQVAEMLYWTILQREPADIEAWQGVGRLMMLSGRETELIERCTAAIDAEGLAFLIKSELRVLRAQAQERIGRTRDALVDYEIALRFLPFHPLALNNAAWLISQEQPERIADAKAHIDKVLALQPRAPEFWDTAAAVYAVLGQHDKALGQINQALKLGPAPEKEPAYRIRRARILVELGRKGQAVEELKTVLDRFPKTPQAIAAGDLLRQLAKE